MPTGLRVGETFKLRMKGEDKWGNPSDQCDATFKLKPSNPGELAALLDAAGYKAVADADA